MRCIGQTRSSSPFGGIPRNWKPPGRHTPNPPVELVPPSGGSLEIGNQKSIWYFLRLLAGSPFGGIPRNWKHQFTHHRPMREILYQVPPSGGSLEIGNIRAISRMYSHREGSPFGGIPRNWKLLAKKYSPSTMGPVPPSGGSLEIGNEHNYLP